jgi:5-methylcytosine-specific restriction enzyme subunit McrC
MDGVPRAVVDAKHKQLSEAGAPGEDAYQMLAYCTGLNVRRGYLVYAADSGAQARDLRVKNSGCEICVRTIDIREPPEALLGQVADLATEIAHQVREPDATLVALW